MMTSQIWLQIALLHYYYLCHFVKRYISAMLSFIDVSGDAEGARW